MGGGAKKALSVVTLGLSDVATGNKPFGSFSSGNKIMQSVGGALAPALPPAEGTPIDRGLTGKAIRPRTQTAFNSALGGYAGLAKKMLLGQ